MERHDGVTISDENWPFYLWTSIGRVDDDYAAALAQALSEAEAKVAWAKLPSEHPTSLSTTVAAIKPRELAEVAKIQRWCEGGGFNVGYIGQVVNLNREQ